MNDTLDVLMCHGWIDGIRRKLDIDRTMQLISKRRDQDNGTWDAMANVDALVVPDDLKES